MSWKKNKNPEKKYFSGIFSFKAFKHQKDFLEFCKKWVGKNKKKSSIKVTKKKTHFAKNDPNVKKILI